MSKKIVVSVVNFKNEEEVLRYASNLSEQTAFSQVHLLVTNNGYSSVGCIDLEKELSKLPLSVDFYDPGNNLGYLTGVLHGYSKYIESNKQYPVWMVVSNTDIDIQDKKFFEKLLANNYPEDIWCIAPSVFSESKKTYDNPQYIERVTLSKLNRLIWIHERPFLAYFYVGLSKIKAVFMRRNKQESRYVYSAHGCFFILKTPFVNLIKDYIFDGFLFSEEAYIAETILLNGKKVFYDSKLEVIHNDSSVTKFLNTKKRAKLVLDSLVYIRKKFYFTG